MFVTVNKKNKEGRKKSMWIWSDFFRLILQSIPVALVPVCAHTPFGPLLPHCPSHICFIIENAFSFKSNIFFPFCLAVFKENINLFSLESLSGVFWLTASLGSCKSLLVLLPGRWKRLYSAATFTIQEWMNLCFYRCFHK